MRLERGSAAAVVRGAQELLADRFGIYGQTTRNNTVGRPVGIVPGSFANHDGYELSITDRKSVQRFANCVGLTGSKQATLQDGLARMVEPLAENDFAFHYVGREHLGIGLTYDIEVEQEDHLFVLANGAIVSNSKQLQQVSHRLVVVGDDDHRQGNGVIRGMPVNTEDPDNAGALLGNDTGDYARNTFLTPKILKDLVRRGHERILVRSPIVGGSPDGGVYARDVGVRERGTLPGHGEQVAPTSAQALAEPVSQTQLSSKHAGGVVGQSRGVSGFDAINQLIQSPETAKGGASHADVDGVVSKIEDAPAGGKYVTVGDTQHHVREGARPQGEERRQN